MTTFVLVPGPKNMEPSAAAAALERALGAGFRGELTVADAAAKSGLALRDAEAGLFSLVSTYRGHLRATEKGELLYRFPAGFSRAWERRARAAQIADKVGRALAGTARFVVRAWISIVLLAYAALFLAIIVGSMFANQGGRDRRSVGVGWAPLLFRVVFDALFWTFHPFSPFAVTGYGYGYGYGSEWGARSARRDEQKDKTPFYERVNRYFFGPTKPPEDPRALEKAVVQEIRAQKGRIGLSDVIRVTGLPREDADPLLARLMLDYDGEVDVDDSGGIAYRFESLRVTAESSAQAPRPKPIWEKKAELTPLTGNEPGTNVLITALNGFNLVMGFVAIGQNITLWKLPFLFHGVPLFRLPYDGLPIALGVVPIIFSAALFTLPLARAVFQRGRARAVRRENGRRAILRTVLTHGDKPVTEGWLRASFEGAAGRAPTSAEVTREVVALGGDVDLEAKEGPRYRFPDFELEAKAVQAEREAAAEEEAKPGPVVFSSDA
jgi:hypothetical protein